MNLRNIKLNSSLVWGVGSIVMVVFYAGFSYIGLSSLVSNTDWVEHTHSVITKSTEIEKLVVDIETGQRGFLVTGVDEFLEPYENGKVKLFQQLNDLKKTVSDNPAQVNKIERIEVLLKRWLVEIAEVNINSRRHSIMVEEIELSLQDSINKGTGKKYLDKIRGYLGQLDQMFSIAQHEKARNTVLAISKNLVDKETGQRGFLITGNEGFLEPYYAGSTQLQDNIDQLYRYIDKAYDRDLVLNKIREIELLAVKWENKVALTAIKLRKEVDSKKSSLVDLNVMQSKGAGKKILDQLRSITNEINAQFIKADNTYAQLLLVAIVKDMVDRETGIRGFIITGKEEFLEPYRNGKNSFNEHINKLNKVVKNAYDINLASRLTRKIVDASVLWDEQAGNPEIALQKKISKFDQNSDSYVELEKSGAGKIIIDQIRNVLADFKKIEKDLLEERAISADFTSELFLWINALGALLIIIFSVVINRITHNMKINNTNLEIERGKLEVQDWIKTNASHISSSLSGIGDISAFADTIMREMAPELSAQVGLFYHAKKDKNNELLLALVGSYAYKQRKNLSNEFSLGEGLVGQCALERKSILLEKIPDDYIHVSSGCGESKPLNIVVFPVIHEDKLLAVIEFASINVFSEKHKELISHVENNIGVIFNNIISQQHTENLLLKSQELSEELQTQQEELRAANETLEDQTQQLKASEEELNVSNEELREQQEVLLTQKEEIEKSQTELVKKADDLNKASKYKSEFLANMSHELRTPLNSLLILSRMLAENKEGNLTERQIEDAQVIHNGGKDLLTLINDIMDLSKVEAGMLNVHIDEVSFEGVIANLERLFGHVANDKGLQFLIEQEDNTASVIQTDAQRVEQILKNFLSNAFKFTEQGRVTFSIHNPEPSIKFSDENNLNTHNSIGLSVIDTGIGIPEEKQKLIFESFQQEDGSTSRKYGGTGLGLSISKELASLLGGEIKLSSEKNVGSTFTLYLPLNSTAAIDPSTIEKTVDEQLTTKQVELPETAPQNEPPAADEPSLALQSMEVFVDDDRRVIASGDKTILIIEDDATFARVLVDSVHSKKYKALVTNKGRDGLFLAMNHLPKGILLDLGLPDINGQVVLEQLKFHLSTRDIPVHIISGKEEKKNSLLADGAFSFLTKPVEIEDIETILSDIRHEQENSQKTVLVIEDDKYSQQAITRLIKDDDVNIVCAASGSDALAKINSEVFDCIILDLGLPDMSGNEILKSISTMSSVKNTPVIVYTGRDISDAEQQELNKYTQNIIIKGAESPERLLDDVSLFLHRVTSDLPEDQKNVINLLHNEDSMLKDRRVLLVDDDMRNLFALSRQLEDIGLDVEVASNGQEAVDKLEDIKPDSAEAPIELILMDIMMPILDGYEATKAIRKMPEYADVPIIALTAKAMQDDREKCINAGASEYLTKPIDIEKLLSMLRIWLFRANS